VQQYPAADEQLKQLPNLLGDIEDVAKHTPPSVGERAERVAIVKAAEEYGASYCKALNGKTLFSAMYDTCTVTLHVLKAVLKVSSLTTQEDVSQEVRRRKRRATDETAGTS
jgi:hypothetical protein